MRRINAGTTVAAAGAVLLLVSLFLDWYDPGLEGWTAFEVWDLVLAGLAIATLVLAAEDGGWWRGPTMPVRAPLLGGAAVVIVLAALLNHPPAAIGADTDTGIWLALLGAALMAAGAVLGEARVSLTLHVDRRARAAPAGPDVPPAAPGAAAPGPDATSPGSVRRGSLLDDDAETAVMPTPPPPTPPAGDDVVPPGATS